MGACHAVQPWHSVKGSVTKWYTKLPPSVNIDSYVSSIWKNNSQNNNSGFKAIDATGLWPTFRKNMMLAMDILGHLTKYVQNLGPTGTLCNKDAGF